MIVYIRSHGGLRRLEIADHSIPLGEAGLSPQKTVKAMLEAFNMTKQRCYNPLCKDYRYYGGRGVTIDPRWLADPLNMVVDMGLRPEGYTLERENNDMPYRKDNCVWATRYTQAQNTRSNSIIEYQGEARSISEWERLKGFKPRTLKARLNRLGYSVEEAMSKEVKCGGLIAGKEYAHIEDQSWRDFSHLTPPKPKFSGGDLDRIRVAVASGLSRSEVARRFNTSTTTVSNIVDKLGAYQDA